MFGRRDRSPVSLAAVHGHGSRGGHAYTCCTSTHNHGQDLNSLKLDLDHLIALKISLDLLTVVTKSVLTHEILGAAIPAQHSATVQMYAPGFRYRRPRRRKAQGRRALAQAPAGENQGEERRARQLVGDSSEGASRRD